MVRRPEMGHIRGKETMVSNRSVISVNVSRNALRVAAFLVCAIMVLSAASMAVGTGNNETMDGSAGDYVPGELLVKFKDGTKNDDKHAAKAAVKGKGIKTFKNIGVSHWKLGKDMTVDKALKELGKKKYADIIEFAEPNYYQYADGTVTAAYRGHLWGMHNFGQTGGTADADIDALEMWQSYTDASSVVVGVIDTGIDYNNDDLKNNIWENAGEIGTDDYGKDMMTNNVDDDGNGFVDDYRGWDFWNNDNDPMDDRGHGSHVSGTIGGDGDNGVGVAGVCWDVKLMPLKFLNSGGSGTTDGAIAAINYAAWFKDVNGDNIVRITSNSWGGGRKSKPLEKAISGSGALFIASAGNSASSILQYPAGYTCDNIISVAATDHNDDLASFSNYGSKWVDLGAPGVSVLSCVQSNNYAWYQGTSMAVPHVTGVAALLMAENTGWSLDTVKSKIMTSGDALSSLNGKTVSGKRLNANNALGATTLPSDTTPPSAVSDLALSDETYTSMKLTWSAPGDDGTTGTAWLYDIRYATSTITDSNWGSATQVGFEPGPEVYDSSQSMVVTGLNDDTTYHFAMKTYDELGNLADLSGPVPSLKTKGSTWTTYPMDNGETAYHHSFVYDNNGNPAIVYKDTSTDPRDLMYAKMDRLTKEWTVSKVTESEGGGVDIAFDSNNDPGIVYYDDDAVKCALWNGDSWDITQLEPRKAYNDYCSIAFHGTKVGVTYYLGGPKGGLMYATYDGSSWSKEAADPKAGARYNALAYDSKGLPGIAYSDNNYGGDYMLDSMMYAKWDGSDWNIEEIEGGTIGFGVFCDLAFDSNDYPRIVHRESGARYLEWDGEDWTLTMIDGDLYGGYTNIAITSSDVSYVCYLYDGNVRVGYKVGDTWTIEPVDMGITSGRGLFIDYYDDGSGTEYLGIGYVDTSKSMFAEKTL